jgi:hypothetical protein
MRLNFQFNPDLPNASIGSFSFIGDPHIQFQIKVRKILNDYLFKNAKSINKQVVVQPMGSSDMGFLPKVYDWLFDLIRTTLNPLLVWPQKKEFTLGAGEPRDLHMDVEPITDLAIIDSEELHAPPGFQVLARTITKLTSANLNSGSDGNHIFVAYSREPSQPPITALAVICPGLGERAPDDFTVIEKTPSGENASLNAGNKGTDMYLCYQRSPGKPPITGIAILNMKAYRSIAPNDRASIPSMNEFTFLDCTPHGHKANLNRKTEGEEIFILYRGGLGTNTGYEKRLYSILFNLRQIFFFCKIFISHSFFFLQLV